MSRPRSSASFRGREHAATFHPDLRVHKILFLQMQKTGRPVYDAIIVGLGGMGSATVFQLASRKQCVLGIEQFTSPHNRGASHGKTRIIRQSYYEDPAYVPLLLR